MPTYTFETWDVFTATRFAGNPLAIVHDAQGLSPSQMQILAGEFNLAETVFILPPENRQHTARLRIFTPRYEMPFAGHPTVGAAVAIARVRGVERTMQLELNAGLFEIALGERAGVGYAQFTNPNPPREAPGAPAAAALEAALSLPAGAAARGPHRPRRIGAGVDFIYVQAPLAAVRDAKINSAAWERLDLAGVVGVVLYADGGEAADAHYHVRMFAPDAGVPEDPATGSAAAALPGQIARAETLANGVHDWVVEQGVEMGRPSRIDVSVQIVDGEARRVRIGGCAVPVSRGEISV